MAITLQWSDDYCIDAEIDREHKRLFALANTVFALIDAKSQASELKDTIRALYEYLGSHFANEERLMRKIEFSDLDRHAARHREIVARMNRIVTSCRTLDQLNSQLRHLMLDWVVTHILRHDRAIALSRQRSARLPANAGMEPGRG